MKIIRTLTITVDEFYDDLEASILTRLNASQTDGKYDRDSIRAGLRYVQGPKTAPTSFLVTDYVRGVRYCAEARSLGDVSSLSYHTEPKEKGLLVIYEQIIEGYEEASAKKNLFLRGFSDAVYLSRMSNSLYDIQSRILRQREGIPEPKTFPLSQRKEPALYRLYKKSLEKKEK